MNTGGAWTITCKELRLLARDRRALVILLLMPLLIIAILGVSTGKMLGRRDGNAVLRIALANEDGGPLSFELVEALSARPGVDLEHADGPDAARRRVDDGGRVAAVVIGPAFGERAASLELCDVLEPKSGRLAGGLQALDLAVRGKPSLTVTNLVVEQLVLGEAMRVVLPFVARREPLVRAYLDARTPATASAPVPDGPEVPVQMASEASYDNVVYQVLVPSYAVLFAFFLINVMARALIHERQMGTMYRLRAAPITSAALLLGQTVPFFVISLAQGALLFIFGRALFGMSWGGVPAMLLVVLACTSLAATGLGLLTATLVRSETQVSAYANLIVIGFAGISGCFMPRDWLPDLVRQVSLATPHAWALMAYDQLLTHATPDLAHVWPSCAMLIAFAAGFFVMAWLRFRTAESNVES